MPLVSEPAPARRLLRPDAPPAWTSTALGEVLHGFFGREGGVSTGIYASLNAGPGSKDDDAAVAENRRRIAAAFGATRLISLHQVHSAKAVLVEQPFDGHRPEADALVTTTPSLVLTILTADCAPILFFEPEAGVIGAAHAGWKGAIGGVIEASVGLIEAQGGQRGRIRAAIGPCIHPESYEVGAEFRDRFVGEDASFARCFTQGEDDKFQFDLPGFVARRLAEAGVGTVESLAVDTYAQTQACFSHRRSVHFNHGDYGRNCAAIML